MAVITSLGCQGGFIALPLLSFQDTCDLRDLRAFYDRPLAFSKVAISDSCASAERKRINLDIASPSYSQTPSLLSAQDEF